MKSFIPFLAGLVLLASIAHASGAAFVSEEAQHIPGTSVSLVAPKGFELSASFAGFIQVSTGASLMVIEADAGFDEIVLAWEDTEALAAQGMELLTSEPAPYESLSGVLCKVAQDAGTIQVTKWIWIFGTETRSVLVLGNCPNDFVETTLASVKAGVLSATWNPDEAKQVEEEPAFAIDYTAGMTAMPFSVMLMFTVDGDPDPTGKKPLFIAGPSLGAAAETSAAVCEERLRQTDKHHDFKIQSSKPIEIDGLTGWEIHASAKDEADDVSKSIYQVMLFEGTSYWLFQGLVAAEQSNRYIPEFEKMAKSFRRTHDTLVSASELATLSIPTIWSMRSGIAEGVEMQAGHPIANCYLIVGSAPKDDLPGGFEEYTELVFSDFRGEDDAELTETTVNGLRCLSGEYIVHTDGLDIAYFLTVIDGSSANYALIIWCMAPEQEITRPEFRRILSTFKERG